MKQATQSVNKEINMFFLSKVLTSHTIICSVTLNCNRINCQITNSGFKDEGVGQVGR